MNSAKVKMLVLSFSILVSTTGLSNEIYSMKQILPYVDQNTLVVFDIDNTLAESRQMLGTDQSFDWMKARYLKAGLDDAKATESALLYWQKIQHFSEMKPVESSTPAIVRRLIERKIHVMGLTARGRNIAERTRRQLSNIGIKFATKSLNKYETALGYHGGIIFATGRNKGDLLKIYLTQVDSRIKRVIFVDDKLHNIQDVRKAFQNTKWELLTFRYGRADKTVAGFNPKIAEIQSFYLNRILSDEHARAILTRPQD